MSKTRINPYLLQLAAKKTPKFAATLPGQDPMAGGGAPPAGPPPADPSLAAMGGQPPPMDPSAQGAAPPPQDPGAAPMPPTAPMGAATPSAAAGAGGGSGGKKANTDDILWRLLQINFAMHKMLRTIANAQGIEIPDDAQTILEQMMMGATPEQAAMMQAAAGGPNQQPQDPNAAAAGGAPAAGGGEPSAGGGAEPQSAISPVDPMQPAFVQKQAMTALTRLGRGVSRSVIKHAMPHPLLAQLEPKRAG